jgi:hypothetical protein
MRKSVWILLTFLMFDCATSEYVPPTEPSCLLGRWVYKQDSGNDVSFEIEYVANTVSRIDLIMDETLFGDQWATNKVYKHIYKNDSLYIKDFTAFKEGATYITAQLSNVENDERIQSVVTTFPDNGTKVYRYTFDYSKDSQITVTLEQVNGSVALFDSRGVYHFNADDNIDTLRITRNPDIHGGDVDNYTSRMKVFTYDIVRNPLIGIVMANFTKPQLPDVTYFNAGNRLTEHYDDVTRTYTFEYGTDPMPNKMTTPEGVVEKYDYPNCTN